MEPLFAFARHRSGALFALLVAAVILAAPSAYATTGACESLPGGVIELESTGGAIGPAGYATLGAAFADINNGVYTGDITIDVCGDTTESASAVLNASGSGAASYGHVTIAPAGGASRTISGAIAGALIDLNGAHNVVIDGLGGNGNALTIDNSSATATAATIRFIADASSDVVRNCTIKGSSTGTATGTIVFATGTTTGNTGDTINANTILPSGANLPTNAIYSAGSSTSIANTGIAITNNNISDFFNAAAASNGIFVASNSATWTITGNRLFQTATRTATTAATHRAINVVTAGGGGYVVNNNTVGFASAAGSGTTTYAGSVAVFYRGIELTVAASPASEIQGNTVSGISFSTASNSTAVPGVFSGISVLGGSANIGTTLGNTVGSASTTGAITITSTVTGSLSTGIYAAAPSATLNVQNNTVGGITASSSTAAIGFVVRGIQTDGALGNVTLSGNLVGSTSVANSVQVGVSGTTTAVTTFVGINNNATGTITITNNTVQNDSVFGSGASIFQGINNAGGSGVLTITGNLVLAGTSRGTGTSQGIVTSAAAATLQLNVNAVRGMTWNATSGAFRGIEQNGNVTTAIEANDNKLGDASTPLMTYNGATSGVLMGLFINGGANTSTLSVQRNDFRGTGGVATSNEQDFVYVGSSNSSLTQTIADNTLTNLNVNSSGSIFLVRLAGSLPANGTRTVSGNTIVTAFTKGAGSGSGGSVYGIYDTSFSAATATSTIRNNNFSNLSLGGTSAATSVLGTCVRSDDFATKIIRDNVCNAWTGGVANLVGIQVNNGVPTVTTNTITNLVTNNNAAQSTITGVTVNGGAATATVSSNTINTFTCANGTVTGINVREAGAGSSNTVGITSNTISGFTSTTGGNTTGINLGQITPNGTFTANVSLNVVSGLSSASSTIGIGSTASATFVNIFRNRVYDLQLTSTSTGSVTGIVGGGGTSTVKNNLIGDLRAPAATNATGPSVIGITASGTAVTANFWFNTVYLTGTSTGSPFSTASVYAGSGPNLVMRNNLLVNATTPTGTGHAIGLWRAYQPLFSYDTSSNNNEIYAGTAYYDGVTLCPTLSDMWAVVYPRESASFSENPTFQSTLGTSPNFLHIVGGSTTQLESHAVNIAGLTDDVDAEIRAGNPGYAGTGTAPDVGADEFEGAAVGDVAPPAIVYAPLASGAPYATRSFTATITDATGVATGSGVRPRVYFKKSTDANDLTGWKWVEATGTGGSPFTFTMDYSLLNAGGVTVGDTIQYFVVAQDTVAPTPNVGLYQGAFAATPAGVDLTAAAFPIGGTINSYVIAPAVSGGRTVCASGCDFASLTNPGGLFEAINGSVLAGNVTVDITGDLTAETGAVALNQWPEDPAGNFTLTIRPSGGAARTISGTMAGGLIRLFGADRVTIDGLNTGGDSLTISNASATSGSAVINLVAVGVLDTGCHDVVLRNLNILGGATTSGIYGITLSGTTSVSSPGADNDRITIDRNTISRVYYGIWIYGAPTPVSAMNDNLAITNNVIGPAVQGSDSIAGSGIYMYNSANPVISNNVIHNLSNATTAPTAINLQNTVTGALVTGNTISNLTTAASGGGSTSVAGVYTGSLVSNATISGNRISAISNTLATGAGARGIVINSIDGAGNVVANNVITDIYTYPTSSNSTWPIGIHVEGSPTPGSLKVYHNSVNLFGAHAGVNAASSSADVYLGNGVYAVDLRDNVLANTYDNSTSTTDKNYAVYAANYDKTVFVDINSNDYYVSGPNPSTSYIGNLAGTNYSTLAAWQGATTKDANSLAVNPSFTSSTDLHLPATSAMLGAGQPLAGITTDADANPRSLAKPTIGSYEIASADLATTVHDAVDPIATGAVETYTITLTNNGPNAATAPSVTDATPSNTTFSAVNAPAGWNCTTPPVGGTGTVSCSGPTLAVGGTATFTLNVVPNWCVGSLPTPVASTSNTATASSTLPDVVATNTAATENTAITDNGACTDNSVCTTVDVCSLGSCVGTTPLNCDDSVRCTADSCDAALGCQHTALPLSYTNYADADNDTYGNPATGQADCLTTPPAGRVMDNTDCNDSDPTVHPGAYETCDGVDNNCDGRLDDAQASADCNEKPGDWACTTNTCSPTGTCFVSTVTCDVAGHVFYYRDSTDADSDGTTEDSSTKGVPQATLDVTGGWTSTGTSGPDGAYSAAAGGHVTVQVRDMFGNFTKPADANGTYQDGISSLDASLVSKAVVGFKTLSPLQRLAGDVTGNGRISSYDASLIAQKAVGLIARFPVATMNGHDSDWAFTPASHTASVEQSSANGLDFAAVLYGDVSANWGEPAFGLADAASDPQANAPLDTTNVATPIKTGRGFVTNGGSATASTVNVTTGGTAHTALLYLAQGPTRNQDGTWTVVLGIAHADGILGLDLALHTDPHGPRITGVRATGIASNFIAQSNGKDGATAVSLYSATPMTGTGSVLVVTLSATGNAVTAPLTVNAEANEGQIPLAIDGTLRVAGE